MYDEGREPPATFYRQPEIADDLRFYWDAFDDLKSERQYGMGVGPIPRSKIKDYGREDLGIECEDALDRFCAIIRKMDDEYVAAANSPKKKTHQREIPIDDAEGVKDMFGNIAKRKDSERDKKTRRK